MLEAVLEGLERLGVPERVHVFEDGEKSALRSADVRAEFSLEGDERLLFIHHTYIVPELYWHLKHKVQSKTPFTPSLSYFV